MFAQAVLFFFGTIVVHSLHTSVVKCCEYEYMLNKDMECFLYRDVNVKLSELLDLSNEINVEYINCLKAVSEKSLIHSDNGSILVNDSLCIEVNINKTETSGTCSNISKHSVSRCDSILTPLKFWGASIIVLANMIYIFPYLIIVILYIFVAELHKRIYDRAVMSFCCTQVGISCVICIMAYFILCHKPLGSMSYALFGLSLMFLTVSGMLWQLIICFDMTLTITRFQWAPSSDTKDRDKDRKFFVYSTWVWGVSALPTAFAGLVELSPFVPKSWIIKPHFDEFHNTNIAVIVYVTGIPILVCIINNILFFYTTYVIISVKQAMNVTEQKRKNNLMKKYFFYLRLYLLMDAPWLTGALSAIYTDMWILKFARMIQPIAMVIAMLPRKTFLVIVNKIINKLNY